MKTYQKVAGRKAFNVYVADSRIIAEAADIDTGKAKTIFDHAISNETAAIKNIESRYGKLTKIAEDDLSTFDDSADTMQGDVLDSDLSDMPSDDSVSDSTASVMSSDVAGGDVSWNEDKTACTYSTDNEMLTASISHKSGRGVHELDKSTGSWNVAVTSAEDPEDVLYDADFNSKEEAERAVEAFCFEYASRTASITSAKTASRSFKTARRKFSALERLMLIDEDKDEADV